jgi:aldose sugar dehydrogenase
MNNRFRPTQLLWHVLVIFALACLPAIKWNAAWWEIPLRTLFPAALLIGAYALSAAIVIFTRPPDGMRSAMRALLLTLSVFALCLFGFLLSKLEAPRYMLLPSFFAAVVLIPLSVTSSSIRRVGWALPILASVAALGVTIKAVAFYEPPAVTAQRSFIRTGFYGLEVTTHSGLIPFPATRGGGLAQIGDRILLGTGDGHLYLLNAPATESTIQVEELPQLVPSNREEFAAAFGGTARSPTRAVDWTEKGAPKVQTWRFRVADVIAQPLGDRTRIYASHHYWNTADKCFIVRVSMIEGATANLAGSLRDAQWTTIYDTTPCVPLEGEQRKRGKNPFKGEEVGGRLAMLDENTLLLTVGDHGFYGLESLQLFAQDPNASYGKTIRIDVNARKGEIFTTGHRNPQGLYISPDKHIWLSEHGSQGGDEINLLSQGTNYGWPFVTYGTEYGMMVWPISQQQNRHEGYAQPVFAYTPSIGATSLIQLEGDEFPVWAGDLMLGSLSTRSLYRLVLDGTRIILSEPIPINERVRDLHQTADGRILVWTDDAEIMVVEQSSGIEGVMTFGTLCMGCHQAVDGLSHRIGPDLHGIVGRGIGDATGFGEYSSALRARQDTWTRENLDAFLKDPQAFAPGTTMAFPGVKEDEQRALLIKYLESLRGETTTLSLR